MMKCNFTQIYAEVGAAYSLSHMLLNPLQQRLDALGKYIPLLGDKLKSDDFVLNFIISATRKNDSMYTKGPSFLPKRKRVEFSIFIPYREIIDFGERIEYVLGQLANGIKAVLEKYEVDTSGVDECVQELIVLAKQSPLDYQYRTQGSS